MTGNTIKMLHAADIHAERPLTGILSKEKAYIRRKEIEDSLRKIVEVAKAEQCQILLIAGDLFEHKYARVPFMREVVELFSSIPAVKVFIAPGNHDPVVADSLYTSLTWPENVTVFTSENLRQVFLGGLPVTIYGLGWTRFIVKERLLKGFRGKDRGGFNVLVCHGEFTRGESSDYFPILPEDLENSGVDYVALGHIHTPGQFRVGTATAVYPGCPEPLDAGDQGEHGAFLVTLSQKGTGRKSIETQFVPLAARQMRSVELDITGLDTVEKVRNAISSIGDATTRKNDIWSVTLKGLADPELDLDATSLEKELSDQFFSLRLISSYVPDYSLDQLLSENPDSLEARFAKRLTQMAADFKAKGDQRQAQVAQRALWYGLDALRLGEVMLRGRRSFS